MNQIPTITGLWSIDPESFSKFREASSRIDWNSFSKQAHQSPIRRNVPSRAAGASGSIAIIRVLGMMAKMDMPEWLGTNTAQVRDEIKAATIDPNVTGIVLQINSGGGYSQGMDEASDAMWAASRVKPTVAYVMDLAASAAYMLASQAHHIYTNAPMAVVGSIGTMAVTVDASKQAEKEGIEVLLFKTGAFKAAGTFGTEITEEQRAEFQKHVDDAQVFFDVAVARGRKFGPQQLEAVKTGKVYMSAEAEALGLIDGIKSFEDVIGEISTGATASGVMKMSVENQQTILAAERQRVAEIRQVCGKYRNLEAKAISEGWTVDQAKQAAVKKLRSNRPDLSAQAGPSAGGGSGKRYPIPSQADLLAAAVMARSGFESQAEKVFGPQTMEHSRHLHRLSMVDMCRAHLGQSGQEVPVNVNEMLKAAFSTSSLPMALSNTANKVLESAYAVENPTWRSWCSVRPAANFKPHTSIRPTFLGDLEQVGKDGEIKHGNITESYFQWRIDTYAKMFGITRQDVINDDLSVFSELIPSMGKSAARSLSNLIYKTLLANAGNFFAAGNNNLETGVGSPLSATSLATVVKKLRVQKDAEGNTLDQAPAVLLVPPELEFTGRQLLNSVELARASTNDQAPTGNPLQGLAKLEVEGRLSNASFTNYSATGWYLLASPASVSMVVGFLNGQETPTIETADSDFSKLGQQFRCFFDYGCAFGDYRGAQKSAGA